MSGYRKPLIRSFRLSDLETYRDRAVEIHARDWFIADGLDHLEADPYAQTAEIDGTPVCSGGLADQGGGLAFAWAVMTAIPRKHMTAVHRAYGVVLRGNSFKRVETFVEATFHDSLRWCRLLGFEADFEHPTVSVNGMLFVRMVFRGKQRQ